MIVHLSGLGVLDDDVIHQVDAAAILYDIIEQPGGLHGDHQRAKLHLIQRIVGHALLEYHGAGKLAGAHQGDLARLHPEGGCDSCQARQLALLVDDIPAAVAELHIALGVQTDHLRLLPRIGLPSLDGQDHRCAH